MIKLIRKKAAQKTISIVTTIATIFQILIPNLSYALTGGPSQPEVESFTPVGTTDMVDLFTGDFNYNIPLLSVDGYPINLAYSAGSNMDQEASWVGLGWSLNPGVINRNMRGVPDDFNGEQLEKQVYMKPNWTVGVKGSGKLKLFGLKGGKKFSGTASLGIFFNNYKGFGVDASLGGFNISKDEKEKRPPQDTIKLQNLMSRLGKNLGSRAIGSLTNMASDIFPESRIFMNAISKYGARTKAAQFMRDHNNVSTNYSVRSYEYGSYTPEVNMEFNQQNYKLGFSFGGSSLGIFASPNIEGTFAYQQLAKEKYNKSTFGYLYHWNKNSNDVILDINREKDAEYTKNKPVLPIPISTYDLYNISGQGVSGMIKPFRNGIDVYADDQNKSNSYSGGANIELGLATDVHTEIHVNGQVSTSKSEKWITGLSDFLEEKRPEDNADNALYERTYFRTVGERVPINTQYAQNANINTVLSPKVKQDFMTIESPNSLVRKSDATTVSLNNTYSGASNIFSTKREKRNQLVSFLTYANKEAFIEPNIISYSNDANMTATVVPVLNDKRRANHIGEFKVTKSDGSRYVYGIAAYNNYQREVSFTTAATGTATPQKGIIAYNEPDADKVLTEGDNKKGFDYTRSDRYYSSTKTKGYAHSYLLTSILSDDYVDVMPRGAGPEDLGNYTKFDYTLSVPEYTWRTPYNGNTAQYSEGLRSEQYDNKASFVEGKKELWYLKRIRSKNQVAIFYTSTSRTDAQSAKLIGTSLSNPSSYLQKIVLYDRMEYEKFANPDTYAKPIKTIYFVYDNSLCKGLDNASNTTTYSSSGKLTLTEVYTTFGSSSKKFASYKFTYANNSTDLNPDYNMASIDRWGNYKPERTDANTPHNLEFPYVEQDQTKADANAAVWSLTKIHLPSGADINVSYEADDYAYVQNKRAMQMMHVEGIGASDHYTGSNVIYIGNNVNNYLYFKLPTNTNGLSATQYVNEVMAEVKNICFRVMLQLSDTKYEWVNGYADVDGFGLCEGDVPYFYVKVKQKNLESLLNSSTQISPLTKAGFNFIKTNMPHTINPELADLITDDNDVRAEEVFYKLISVGDIFDKLNGIDQKLLTRSNCDRIKEYGGNIWGWARLNNPHKDKLGGGHRVKKIVLDDNWTDISAQSALGNLDHETGQEFDYTVEETLGTAKRKISSGVAAFEPAVGSEENPFKQPIGFERKVRILPDEEDYIDGPVGESFYPSAVVGYSKVTVTNLKRVNPANSSNTVKTHGVGKTVSEFYTAKDFPVIVDYTSISLATVNPPMIDLLFYSASLKRVGVSQGFQIVLNDMHGKPKANYVYAESQSLQEPEGKLISGVKYFYQTEANDPTRLNNEVDVIDEEDGTRSKKVIAVETEMYADNRTKTDDFFSGAVELNWTTLISLWGLTFPTIVPEATTSKDNFYSSTLLTVKNYYGIQTKTEVFQDGAYIYNENLAYDGATGEVLVSKTTNEFKEDQYNTVYPAHWRYDAGMGQAYKNTGVHFSLSFTTASVINFSAPAAEFIQDNDEILCEYNNSTPFMGVVKMNSFNNFKIYVQDKQTNTFLPFVTSPSPSTLKITVIRSGRRNMQSNPIFSATTLLNPIKTSGLLVDANAAILDAKAVTFSNAKYNYKSFNDEFNVTVNTEEVLDAINHLFANQQIDLKNGVENNLGGPGNLLIYKYPITVSSTILNGSNDFTNAFFHKINLANGCGTNKVYISYGYPQLNSDLDLRQITIEIPICEINKNVQSTILVSVIYRDAGVYLNGSFYQNHKLATILPSVNSSHISSSQSDCNYHYQSLYPSINFDGISSSSPATIVGVILNIDINRCAPDAYERVSLEDHFYKKNEYLAVNPITHWTPSSTYLYKGERNYDLSNIRSTYPDLANRFGLKGVYKTFDEFDWTANADYSSSKWKQSEQSTLIDPYTGAELESKDAIGRYRSVIFAPNKTLVSNLNRPTYSGAYYYNLADKLSYSTKPVLFTENARYCEANVFNFETSDELQYVNPSAPARVRTDRHYFMKNSSDEVYISAVSHTGKNSLQVQDKTTAEFFVTNDYSHADLKNAILPYYPKTGKQFISGWVKIDKAFYQNAASQAFCKLEVLNKTTNAVLTTTSIYPSGPVINGWQRFQGEFNIPAPNTTTSQIPDKLRLTLNSGSTTQIAYFDDIRMHPVDANSKNYLYDEQQRVSVILDENNYATFYYYDHKGELAVVKRETEKGIVTITETRKLSSKF
ncbi:MAG: hypothetical protein V4643_06980 [Bacteroidota bacterium]